VQDLHGREAGRAQSMNTIDQLEAQVEQGKGMRKPFVLVDLVDLSALVELVQAARALDNLACEEVPPADICPGCDPCNLKRALEPLFREVRS
jgi:hypothetical protein